jgi:hypothetical protein
MRFGATPEESVRRILEREPRFVVANPASIGAGDSRAAAVMRDALARDYDMAGARGNGPASVYERREQGFPAALQD